MDAANLIEQYGMVWSPVTFATLLALATALLWMAFRPAPPRRDVQERLNDYLDRGDVVLEEDLRAPFFRRAVWPGIRSFLRFLARLLPNRNLEATRRQLIQAGSPGGLTALDFYGLRVLSIVIFGAVGFFALGRNRTLLMALQMTLFTLIVGYLLPVYWLRSKVRGRKNKILRALPDALDMLTIGVEAGLAFESAMVRVAERWENELSREFKRAVAEMRVGMTREEALSRMAERCGVPELSTFVAVLVQSSQLGVSIAQVLRTQAAEMRLKRRQRAEELARQAGIKMIIPLALFVMPSLFIVILGPIIPRIQTAFGTLGGTPTGLP